MWDELEGLEHDAYVLATEPRQRIFVELGDVASVEDDRASVRTLQAGEVIKSVDFPNRRADKSNCFPRAMFRLSFLRTWTRAAPARE